MPGTKRLAKKTDVITAMSIGRLTTFGTGPTTGEVVHHPNRAEASNRKSNLRHRIAASTWRQYHPFDRPCWRASFKSPASASWLSSGPNSCRIHAAKRGGFAEFMNLLLPLQPAHATTS